MLARIFAILVLGAATLMLIGVAAFYLARFLMYVVPIVLIIVAICILAGDRTSRKH